MRRLLLLLALSAPVNAADLQCVVFDGPPFICTARFVGGPSPFVYIDEVPQFQDSFE